MDFQFDTQNYNIFVIDEHIDDDKFYEDIVHILSDNVVNSLPPYFHDIDTIDDAKEWLEFISSEADVLFIQGKFSLSTIGFIFIHTNQLGEAHIGYVLAKEYWNKGIATEVLESFIEFCNETKKWDNLLAGVHRDNEASIRLLEKLGFSIKEENPSVLFYEYKV